MRDTTAFGQGGACVPLFERLLLPEMREGFLEHKARKFKDPELGELAAYINGPSCTADLEALLAGRFGFPPARLVKLRKSRTERRRVIYVYPPRQNALMQYIVWGMHEYDGIFSDSLYSFRTSISTESLFKKIARLDYARDLFIVKTDIHNYGASINPALLLPKVEGIVAERDPLLFSFLEYLIARDEYLVGDEVVHAGMGGLPGVPLSCFINNVYLMELDRVMENRAVLYSRYADDIAIFVETRGQAEELLAQTCSIISGLDLCLNEEKTQIIEPGGSVELLGIQIQDGNFDVADNTMAKAKAKLTHFADKLVRWEQHGKISKEEAARRMASRIDRYFYGDDTGEHKLSWRIFFFDVLTRPDSLHDIDLTCQNLLRIVATGKRGDARYRFRYEDMKALGYRPLVHEYYEHIQRR